MTFNSFLESEETEVEEGAEEQECLEEDLMISMIE